MDTLKLDKYLSGTDRELKLVAYGETKESHGFQDWELETVGSLTPRRQYGLPSVPQMERCHHWAHRLQKG